MGCTYSSFRNRNSSSSNNNNNNVDNDGKTEPLLVFKVVNVDDNGHEKYHGQMEIVGDDMLLRKRGKPPAMVWPLRSVRWYGYEDFIFCFETGRSSPSGEGIFAFRSKQARSMYLAVKEKFQKLNCVVTDMSSEARKTSCQSYRRVVEKVNKESSSDEPPRRPSSNKVRSNKVERKLPPPTVSRINAALAGQSVPKQKKKPLSTLPEEPTGYTEIDFDRTRRFNQQRRMSKMNGGARRTRHDSTISSP